MADVREHILDVATTLFCSHGYTATSTRQIADAVGLRQASLFHYFEKKEEILIELLDRTLRPGLALTTWLDLNCSDPYVALYALSWLDSHNLCANPNNVASLQLLPEIHDERFASFWADRAALRDAYRRFIRSVAEHSGTIDNVDLRCDLVFGLVESVLTWFSFKESPPAETVATSIAEATLQIVDVSRQRRHPIANAAIKLLQKYKEDSIKD
jgi:AcrR family transcriptional regulator